MVKKIILSIMMLVIFVGIAGGCGMKEDKLTREQQDKLVHYLDENIENVNDEELYKIEFKEIKKNEMTGLWRIVVFLNDSQDLALSYNLNNEEIWISNVYPQNIKFDKHNKKTRENLKIIYAEK